MVINIAIKGGLGNQLFQYAFGKHLENKYNCKINFDIHPLLDQNPHLTKRYLLLDRIFDTLNFTEISVHHLFYSLNDAFLMRVVKKIKRIFKKQKYISEEFYSEINIKAENNYYFDGYWQNIKYARLICEEVNQKLAPLGNDLPMFRSISKTKESAAIHVRRGDYVNNPLANSFHGSCDIAYYNRAIQELEKHKAIDAYFIFTDDVEWAKSNMKHTKPLYFFDGNQDNPIPDLVLMKSCNHLILSNSSLSCWAAYLNTNISKIVIAPLNWTKMNKTNDLPLFETKWILI